MGIIKIEEYQKAGTKENSDTQVVNISRQIARTVDESTSATPESLALQSTTTLLRVYTSDIHRLAVTSALTATVYYETNIDSWHDIAVDPGSTLFYRLDS
jgi:hypothetical protein